MSVLTIKLLLCLNIILFNQEVPPLMSAFNSGRYHIKRTWLADLPVPLYNEFVAVQDKKCVTAGDSPVEAAL